MKKYLLLFILSLFLVIPMGASAANKNVRIDFDSHEKFNYFYEYKNSTPFYHFLVSQGSDLPLTLNDYESNYYSSGGFNIRIFYASELLVDFIPANTKYVIVADVYSGNALFSFDGSNISFLNTRNNSTPLYCFGFNDVVFYFFDSSANYIGSHKDRLFNNIIDSTAGCNLILDNIYNISKLDSPDFTYFISKYYYFSKTSIFWNYKTSIVVSDLLLDDEVYLIDNNDNYSSFWATIRKIFSFGDVKDYDVSDSFLDYFRHSKVYEFDTNILSLYHMLVSNDSSSLPENYVAINFSDYKNGFYLVPKRSDISSRYYIAQPTNKNVILSSKLFDISSDEVIYTEDNDIYNTVIDFNYLDECVSSSNLYDCSISFTINDTDFMYSNYIYYFSIDSTKYDFWFYYNSLDFDLYPVSDSDLTFINPNSGNTISFDNSNQRDFLFNVNGYKSTYVGDNSFNLDNFDLSSSGIFKTVTDFVSGFIPTITSIFALIFLIFSSLPTEIQYLFYFLLIGGIIIIIYNLIRGR